MSIAVVPRPALFSWMGSQPFARVEALERLTNRVHTSASMELRDQLRTLGARRKVGKRWKIERSVECGLGERFDLLDWEDVDGWSRDECSGEALPIGSIIVPACSQHLATWAQHVGLEWAARAGVRPFHAEILDEAVRLYYPRNPMPSRSPLPGSRSSKKYSSFVDVTLEEFEALIDALLELGAPVAELFVLTLMAHRADAQADELKLRAMRAQERERIAAADGRWAWMRSAR